MLLFGVGDDTLILRLLESATALCGNDMRESMMQTNFDEYIGKNGREWTSSNFKDQSIYNESAIQY